MKKLKTIICLALALMLSLSLFACGGSKKATLNVLNWGDYIDPQLLKQFENETGIAVKYTTMTSNEEMLVKLASADNIYDVCFPSDYLIEKLVADDLLAPAGDAFAELVGGELRLGERLAGFEIETRDARPAVLAGGFVKMPVLPEQALGEAGRIVRIAPDDAVAAAFDRCGIGSSGCKGKEEDHPA